MSRLTTNYGYNISEGVDLVNPLVDIFPNWEAIDSDLKGVSNDAVGRATELTTGTVHALTRSDADRNVFVFTATSNFTAGDTFTLDGTQVSALTPAGEQLATGCYIIGSDVLVSVHGTLMTMYVSPTKVADSDKLDGHDSTYFATASGVSDLSDDLDAVSDKVGTGVLTTTAQDCVGAINELNSDLNDMKWKDVSSHFTITSSYASISQVYIRQCGHIICGRFQATFNNTMSVNKAYFIKLANDIGALYGLGGNVTIGSNGDGTVSMPMVITLSNSNLILTPLVQFGSGNGALIEFFGYY